MASVTAVDESSDEKSRLANGYGEGADVAAAKGALRGDVSVISLSGAGKEIYDAEPGFDAVSG